MQAKPSSVKRAYRIIGFVQLFLSAEPPETIMPTIQKKHVYHSSVMRRLLFHSKNASNICYINLLFILHLQRIFTRYSHSLMSFDL